MTDYIDSQGTTLKVGDGASPETFATINKVLKLGALPIGDGAPYRERTDLSHTDTRKHTFGLPDMPEIVNEFHFDPHDSTHTALITDYNNKTVRNFRIALATSPAGYYSFSALVKVMIPQVEIDTDVPGTITLKPQSVLTWNAGSA